MNKANRFLYSFIGLVIFQIFMTMEEIIGHFPKWILTLTGKVHLKLALFPVVNISEEVYLFISLIVIIILFVFLAFLFLDSRWSRLLAVIIGVLEIINGGLHILTTLYFMHYLPGSVSAVGVIIFGLLVIYIKPSLQPEAIKE
jgi:hypothetical protein